MQAIRRFLGGDLMTANVRFEEFELDPGAYRLRQDDHLVASSNGEAKANDQHANGLLTVQATREDDSQGLISGHPR